MTKAKVCTSLVGVSVILIRAQCVSGLKLCHGWCREQLRAVSVMQAESKLQEIEDPVALLAVLVEDPKEKEMVAYAQLIIQLSQSCST